MFQLTQKMKKVHLLFQIIVKQSKNCNKNVTKLMLNSLQKSQKKLKIPQFMNKNKINCKIKLIEFIVKIIKIKINR